MGVTTQGLELPIREGSVHLWQIPLADLESPTVLSREERQRAQRRVGEERRRFVARHAAARRIVASYLGCAAEDAPLAAPYGNRPRIDGSPLEISLSCAGDFALLAIACCRVGVDVERLPSIDPDEADDIAGFILGPQELEKFSGLPRRLRRDALVLLWTRKEAYMKAVGAGLGDVLMSDTTVSAATEDATITSSTVGTPNRFSLRDLSLEAGLVGAVAVEDKTPRLEYFEWPDVGGAQ